MFNDNEKCFKSETMSDQSKQYVNFKLTVTWNFVRISRTKLLILRTTSDSQYPTTQKQSQNYSRQYTKTFVSN